MVGTEFIPFHTAIGNIKLIRKNGIIAVFTDFLLAFFEKNITTVQQKNKNAVFFTKFALLNSG